IAAAMICALAACSGPPTIDASSPAACEQSMKSVARYTTEQGDSAAYAAAAATVVGHGAQFALTSGLANAFNFDESGPSLDVPMDTAAMSAALCETFDELTGAAIIAGADSLGREYARRLEEQAARAHYAALLEAEHDFAAVQDSLKGFEVLSASIRQSEGWMGVEAVINMRVRNSTNHAISRAFFAATVTSPNRSVPWIEDEFNYSIAGGLEPGEEASWRLQPNMFQGDWTKVRVPADAQTQIRVLRLQGPTREDLWGGPVFTKGDQMVLDSLRARFGSESAQ